MTSRLLHPSLRGRSGFTLLELLTVIVIIGILAGILVPVLGRTKDRAYELAAKELCAQVVTAWTDLVIDEGRLPSSDLLSAWCSEESESAGQDLVLAMDAGVSSVLNWWRPEALVPAGDKNKFKPRTEGGTALSAASVASPDLELVEFYPHDLRLDRTFVQKCFGFYAPWVERDFKTWVDARVSSAQQSDLQDDSALDELKKRNSPWRVYVMLDVDGNGILTLPDVIAAMANAARDEDGKATIRGTAAAWTRSKDGKRLVASW